MIQKYVFGNPFDTEAVVESIEITTGVPNFGTIDLKKGFYFSYKMDKNDIVYGLGEANRGINKRGYRYISNCSDVPNQTEDLLSMYAAHNFIIVDGVKTFGLFVDYPSILEFDIGYTRQNQLIISCEKTDLVFYVINGESAYDIVKQFRKIIGRSYIPPKFAFGFGQSRWGYKTADDFKTVVRKHRENHIPLDMVYMDIDYMKDYKDFTVNEENFSKDSSFHKVQKDFDDQKKQKGKVAFPNFKVFVDEMREEKIHLIPIIDAGVKIENGYDIYEEGKEKGYFCKRKDGSDFEAAVWPGLTHFPDFLNPQVRAWFGGKYERLISMGIDGFWNDMNEPAIFYSVEGVQELKEFYEKSVKNADEFPAFLLNEKAFGLANNPKDYKRFYHNINGKMICHYKLHNLFGYNMTRAASEAFEKISPDKRILLFSRSSYIGMHRFGGIWMGDNKSWWSHILLNLKMLPSLNMCGFLYIGADLGGFGADTTRDLLLRWLALGIFIPLMRNHSATGTREQEVYQFEDIEDFRHIIEVRYRLIPYLYSEYMKAAINGDMMFKPLAFTYPTDRIARHIEDQLMLGNEIMIAPVYMQNAEGRYVYLPEEMKFVKFLSDGKVLEEILEKGHHYIEVALNEVPLFIRKGRCIPVVNAAETVEDIDMNTVKMIGYLDSHYDLYEDDGISRI